MKDIGLLGLKVRDRVTGFTGVVSSVCFDLYGCVQAVVTPEMKDPGKLEDSRWFDTKRLEKLNSKPVMEVPKFAPKAVIGGAEKSVPRNL